MRKESGEKNYKARLFCFPFAGGSASTYKDWAANFCQIEVCAINLPGRGFRFQEKAHSAMSTLVDALVEALSPELDIPYYFFGHSMGTMVAFELTRKLRALNKALPRHLFLSARPGPSKLAENNLYTEISDSDLITMLEALNGTDKDILANQELLDFMLPSLRADMNIVQTHVYAQEDPLQTNLTVFGGLTDPTVQEQELFLWRLQTSKAFRLHMFEGDHFYLNTQQKLLTEIINKSIQRDL